MTTKYKLAEQVVLRLEAGVVKPSQKVDIQEAMAAISNARNKVIWLKHFEYKGLGIETVPFDLFSEIIGKSKYDETRKRWYISLPQRPLSGLPHNMGVYNVFPVGEEESEYKPLTASFLGMYKGLDAFDLEGFAGYYPERDRLWLIGVEKEIELFVRAIVDSNDISDTEFMPLPVEWEQDVLEIAFASLAPTVQGVRDETVDNSANT